MQFLGMAFGASVGFYQGNVKLLTDDIATLCPTVFAGVPRVYSRIYDKVSAHAQRKWETLERLEGTDVRGVGVQVQQTVDAGSWLKKSIFETAFKNQVRRVSESRRCLA
jgi:long-chain acyl-CoA synthetase